MTGDSIITQLLRDGLDLKTDDTYITTEWRPRALAAVQKAVNEFWKAGFWPFKMGYAYLTFPGGDTELDLPADFHKVGPQGRAVAYNAASTSQWPITYLSLQKFDQIAYIDNAGEKGVPRIYTFSGFNTTTRRQKMRLFPTQPTGTSAYVELNYERRRPTIADSSVVATSNLDQIPEDLHEDVIYIGALDWLMSGLADGRAISEISPRFKQALNQALGELQMGEEELLQYGDQGIPDLGMW